MRQGYHPPMGIKTPPQQRKTTQHNGCADNGPTGPYKSAPQTEREAKVLGSSCMHTVRSAQPNKGAQRGDGAAAPAEQQQHSNETQAEAEANYQNPEHAINSPQGSGTVRHEPHVLHTKVSSPSPCLNTEATGCSPKGTRGDQQRSRNDFLEPSKLGKLNAARRI